MAWATRCTTPGCCCRGSSASWRHGAPSTSAPGLALEWAQRPSVQPAEWARRLCFVRGFARHRSATDSRTEIPPIGLLPHRSTRARPYLYTEEEVGRLLACGVGAAGGLAVDAAAAMGVPLPDRPAQRDGLAHVRSAEPRARRRGPRSGGPDDPRRQVRPVAAGADPPVHLRGAGRLPRATRAVLPPTRSRPMCSSRAAALASTAATFIEPSTRCRAARACARSARARGRGCTTSGIASPFRP